MRDKMPPSFPLHEPPLKSLKVAYLLLALTGFFGFHRLYLRKWISFALYFFVLWFILIGFGGYELEAIAVLFVGIIVDAFLLPRFVKTVNAHITEEFIEFPERFTKSEDDIAPWAKEKPTLLKKLAAPLRIIQFFAGCILFTMAMVLFESDEFVLFLVFILVASGLFTSLDKIVERYPALTNIPVIEDVLDRTIEMRKFYWENEPNLGGSIIGMLTRARTEYAPYWKIAGLMTIAIVLDAFFSFGSDYAPHLSFGDAIFIIILHIYFVIQAVLFVLSPVSAMSYHHSLSGKKARLRVLTIIALALIALTFTITKDYERTPGEVSLFPGWRLDARMEQPTFQADLAEITTMYLFYSYLKSSYPNAASSDPECKLNSNCGPTKKFRDLVAGIAPNTEKEAFEVFDTTYDPNKKNSMKIRVIRRKRGTDEFTVIGIIDEKGKMCSRYQEAVPPKEVSNENKLPYIANVKICDDLLSNLEATYNPVTDEETISSTAKLLNELSNKYN